MSQVASHTVKNQIRSHWVIAVSALLALAATAAIVLVLALDGGSDTSSAALKNQPALRSDGGPDESAVASSIGERPQAATRSDGGPDESAIASSIAGR